MMPRAPLSRSAETGFVLIGVVVFVLALSIIALSLFSISSYEAQFLQRSLDGEQAFQSAVGGLERAKFALELTSRLESVQQHLPLEHVVSALATQVQSGNVRTSGPMDWSPDNPVFLRVTADVNGRRRTVQGSFNSAPKRTFYSQLITTTAGITVDRDTGSPPDRTGTVYLEGSVWEGITPADSLSWQAVVGHSWGNIITDTVDAPDLASYFSAHPAANARPPSSYDGAGSYGLLSGWTPRYFHTPNSSDPGSFYEDASPNILIQVRRSVVWEFPNGVRFDQHVSISGTTPYDCLVIVAGPNPADGVGITFSGGLEADIPVMLVSSGEVLIQDIQGPGTNSLATDLAIYAQNVRLTGPPNSASPAHSMTLYHRTSGARTLNTYFIARFANAGALPNLPPGGNHSLALVAGTWHLSDQ